MKIITDTGIGVAAVATPVWLQLIESGITYFMLFGGAVLLIIRLGLAIREWMDRK